MAKVGSRDGVSLKREFSAVNRRTFSLAALIVFRCFLSKFTKCNYEKFRTLVKAT